MKRFLLSLGVVAAMLLATSAAYANTVQIRWTDCADDGGVANITFACAANTGNRAFQTPLGTKHAFQGWADMFLTTPADGLQDRHAGLTAPLFGGTLQAWYHDFVADRGGAGLGRELDLSYAHALPWSKRLSGLVKLARYRADAAGPTVDTDKAWLQLQYTY